MPAQPFTPAACLTLSLALALGIAAGGLAPGGVGAAAIALGAAGVALAVGRARPAALGIAALALGLARGWAASQGPEAPTGVIPRGMIEAEIVGASAPGPRCRAEAVIAGGRGRWILALPPEACPLARGDRLLLRADAAAAARAAARMPWRRGGFDRRSGLPELAIARTWPAARGPDGPLRAIAERRQGAREASRGSPERALVVASVLGMPSALPPAGRGALRDAGLGHILAVSGLHVAIAAMALQGGLRRLLAALGWSAPGLALIGLGPVAAYVALTGGAPSALRAAGMLGLWTLAAALGRPAHGPTILALTAAAALMIWPHWAADPGFQLSLAAMAALVHPGAPRGLWAQSWRVTWATMPVSLWHFGGGALIGALLNLVAIPVFCAWVLPAGALGVLLLPWLGGAALAPASWGAGLLLDLAALAGRAPALPAAALGGLAAGLWALGWLGRRRAPALARAAPPRWALAGVMIASLARIRAPQPEEAGEIGWRAIGGGGPALTIVAGAVDADGAARGVCVADPWLSPGEIVALVEALGGAPVVEVRGGSPHEAAALRRALEREGLWAVDDAGEIACAWPTQDPRALRRALRRCRALGGGRRALIRGEAGGGAAIECRLGEGFRALP